LSFELRKHAVSVRTQLAEPGPALVADRTQIYQVVVNLLRNAYEAMQDAPAGDREIVLRTRQREAAVEVSVSDRGVGLPESGIEKLCEAFVTTKPDGMGMGLAVSSRILKAHRGHLWATSNEGRGATFHFSLPLAARKELER
jgi:signal transduction histidine kinase